MCACAGIYDSRGPVCRLSVQHAACMISRSVFLFSWGFLALSTCVCGSLCGCVCLCVRTPACVPYKISMTDGSMHLGLCITLIALSGSMSADDTPTPLYSLLCASIWSDEAAAWLHVMIVTQQAKGFKAALGKNLDLKIHLSNQPKSQTGGLRERRLSHLHQLRPGSRMKSCTGFVYPQK